jgi:hypothetical protein
MSLFKFIIFAISWSLAQLTKLMGAFSQEHGLSQMVSWVEGIGRFPYSIA